MITKLEPKYALFDSLEQMLAPETLSGLLSRTVTRVACRPMIGHLGVAGGQLDYIDTNVGRYVLKRMSLEFDWVMFSTDDQECRAVRLWQYGLLDQLCPHLEHKIMACSRNKDGWAIFMRDLTEHIFTWDKPMAPQLAPAFLDSLARLHAAFWNDPRLNDLDLGLCDTAKRLDLTSPALAQKQISQRRGVLPDWIRGGWEVMEELLDPDVFAQMRRLLENPVPLFEMLDHYPYTLLHGDYRAANLGYLKQGHPIIFDWQLAARSLMTIDLAWFANQREVHDVMGHARAISYYRGRLETYLNAKFDDAEWQAMIDLGFLVDALCATCFAAYWCKHSDTPEDRLWHEMTVKQRNQQVRDALRWL
jgi:Phosphotransferase enzyme family